MSAATEDTTKTDSNDDASIHSKYSISETHPPFPNEISSRTDASQRQTCLSEAVLKDDDLLSRILYHLVDDGLHDCRRVCRKWRDVCSLLPVKLVDVRAPRFRDAARMFPNATSVTVAVDEECQGDDLFEFISTFTRIKHLQLWDAKRSSRCLEYVWSDIRSLPTRAPFLSQLESLTSNIIISEDNEPWVWMAREHFTNLTQLKLSGGFSSDSLNVDPLPETHKLKSLSIRTRHFFNDEKMLVFPPSANLTELEIVPSSLADVFFLEVREMIRELSFREVDCVFRKQCLML